MGPFPFVDESGNRLVVVFPISVRDPDNQLHEACVESYGKSYKLLSPLEVPEVYEEAYGVVNKNLQTGEHVTVLDRGNGKVTFFTPQREERAWSAWIRVVDISRFLLN